MIEFIRELISERLIIVRVGGSISQNKQADPGILQGRALSATLFLEELGNAVHESFFADHLAIYITTRNKRVETRALQGVTNKLNVLAAERGLAFSTNKTVNMIFRKRRK